MFKPMKITFNMDGTGVYYDAIEPIMLDGLLSSALCRFHVHGDPPSRNEKPFDIPLPLGKWEINGVWGWRASALFPETEEIQSIQFWRKKFRCNKIELTHGSPNLRNGIYREWNMPIPLTLTNALTAYAFGEIKKVRKELKRSIKYLGKKRAYGRGAIVSIEVKEIESDYSVCKDGVAMRWMPLKNGPRLVRSRPPYWNIVDRVECCEIRDEFHVNQFF